MSQVNLTQASKEWAYRPADQRFRTLRELMLNQLMLSNASHEATENLSETKVVVGSDGDLALETKHSGRLKLTHWAFEQFAKIIGSSAQYMRTLATEPDRAAHNLNKDIMKNQPEANVLYVQDLGEPKIVSATSTSYGRLHNYLIAEEILKIGGFRTLPAYCVGKEAPGARKATAEDLHRTSKIREGDWIMDAGLYASTQNSFMFMVDEDMRIDDGTDGGLSMGFFVENSEVGQRAFGVTTFLYRYVCGNHIVWDASDVKQFRMKHMGKNVEERMRTAIQSHLTAYRKTDKGAIQQRLERAMKFDLGPTKQDVSDNLFVRKELGLTRKVIDGAYGLAEQHVDTDGSPRTAWGFAQGLTRFSQLQSFTDARNDLDKAAAKILALVD